MDEEEKKCTELKDNRICVTFEDIDLEIIEELRQRWKTSCSGVIRRIVYIYFVERGFFDEKRFGK